MIPVRSELEKLIPAGDATYDVVVCGSGMAGLGAAAAAARSGAPTLLLERRGHRLEGAGAPAGGRRALIDALAHAIHEDGSGHWTLPASVNLIEGSTGRSSSCWTRWPA